MVSRDDNVQGLRAWAAGLVLAAHICPDTTEPSRWFRHLGAGHAGVLLFFAISGYVIGLVNQRPWQCSSRSTYWQRRLTRLAPLYFIAVLFAAAVAWKLKMPLDERDLIYHFLCLQNFQPFVYYTLTPIWTDHALWTLHYEMVYYAAFLVIWRFRPPFGLTLAVLSIATAAGPFLPEGWRFLSAYAAGFVFWIAGLTLAWLIPSPGATGTTGRESPIAGLLLLTVAIHHAAPGAMAVAAMGGDPTQIGRINLADFVFLPVIVLLLGGACQRICQPSRLARLLCCLPVLFTVAIALLRNSSVEEPRWAIASVTAGAGAALIWWDFGRNTLNAVAGLGGLSYAFYLFHLPIYHLIEYILHGNWIATAFLTIGFTLSVSWFLELRLQPVLSRWFTRFI